MKVLLGEISVFTMDIRIFKEMPWKIFQRGILSFVYLQAFLSFLYDQAKNISSFSDYLQIS